MIGKDAQYTNCYVITGILKNGKRFAPIYTLFPRNYNICKGTVWRINDKGRRIKQYEINN